MSADSLPSRTTELKPLSSSAASAPDATFGAIRTSNIGTNQAYSDFMTWRIACDFTAVFRPATGALASCTLATIALPMAMACSSVNAEGSSPTVVGGTGAGEMATVSLPGLPCTSSRSKRASMSPMCAKPQSRSIAVRYAKLRIARGRSLGLLLTRSTSMRPTTRPSSASHLASGRTCWKYRCSVEGTARKPQRSRVAHSFLESTYRLREKPTGRTGVEVCGSCSEAHRAVVRARLLCG